MPKPPCIQFVAAMGLLMVTSAAAEIKPVPKQTTPRLKGKQRVFSILPLAM